MPKVTKSLIILIFIAMLASGYTIPAVAQDGHQIIQLKGWFGVIRANVGPDTLSLPPHKYFLFTADGQSYTLEIEASLLAQAGGVLALDRQQVVVEVFAGPEQKTFQNQAAYQVISIERSTDSRSMSSPEVSAAISGARPWVSILCKFQDVAAEPRTLGYFLGMFSDHYPGLDHYWRELSYSAINLTGSTATGWHTLPQPRSYYIPNGQLKWQEAAEDCAGAADTDLYFPSYAGINFMFNDNLDGYAWGGSHCMSLDGVFRCWPMTWNPPWGYNNIVVIAHEMGHGFGLPHSANTFDEPYKNQWDVMSDGWSNCNRARHEIYGCLGQHTIAYHKDILGWIPESKKYTMTYTGSGHHTSPASQSYLMAQINLPNNPSYPPEYYTIEYRSRRGYDTKLPGEGIIIHKVNPSRTNPAHVIDIDNNGNTGDAGAIWTVGETFLDSSNGITISVLSLVNDKYQVGISNGAQSASIWLEPLAQLQAGSIFADVPGGYWALDAILRLYNNGITSGCAASPLMYCPEQNVTRAQMAVFLERGLRGSAYAPPPASGDVFADVPQDQWAAAWIEQLAQDRITGGCGDGNYCPENPVTRAQMAVFLLKAKHGANYQPPALGETSGFNDVPASHWAADWIKQLAAENITAGCGDGNYCPDTPVTRAQMAVFLMNVFNLP